MNCCECGKELWGQQQAAYFLIGCTNISVSISLLYAMQIIISLVWWFNDDMNIDRLFYAVCSINDSQQPRTLWREGSGGQRVMWRSSSGACRSVVCREGVTISGKPADTSVTLYLKDTQHKILWQVFVVPSANPTESHPKIQYYSDLTLTE
jgi:hypothetical protein